MIMNQSKSFLIKTENSVWMYGANHKMIKLNLSNVMNNAIALGNLQIENLPWNSPVLGRP